MRFVRAAAGVAFATVLTVVVANPASADNRHRLTGTVTHSRESDINFHPTDAFCVENDPTLGPVTGHEQDWRLWIGAREEIRLRVCYEFTGGAMGGNTLRGVFTLKAAEGSLTGVLEGSAAHQAGDRITMTLTPTSGTFGLAHVHGALEFVGCNTFSPPNPITGVVTIPGSGVQPPPFCP